MQEETNTNLSEQTEDGTLDEDVELDTAISDSAAANGNEVTAFGTAAGCNPSDLLDRYSINIK